MSPGAGGRSVGRSLGGLGRPASGIASRVISARKVAPSLALRHRIDHRLAAIGKQRDARIADERRLHNRAGAQAGQLDLRLENLAILDQDRAVLANPFLVEPLSQADSPPP